MPRDNASMLGRFAEQLIVPESHGAAQQLAGGQQFPVGQGLERVADSQDGE